MLDEPCPLPLVEEACPVDEAWPEVMLEEPCPLPPVEEA
jgi:hypothetical protein